MRKKTKKIYSIEQLLAKQPKALSKSSFYNSMIRAFRDSVELKRLRFGRRCYTLLNKGLVKPENLNRFYRIYSLPKNPFFPLFFKVKQEYLKRRIEKKKEKDEYILKGMRSLAPEVITFIRYLGELEKNFHYKRQYPFWVKNLYPSSKKQVRKYIKLNIAGWKIFFTGYLEKFRIKYPRLTASECNRLVASFVLNIPPEKAGIDEIKKNFRALSKIHHPDTGGESDLFQILLWAKDILLDFPKF